MMKDKSAELAAPIDYKGFHIRVNSVQQADATWVCEYFIVDSGESRRESGVGHAGGRFPSREAAELDAVQKAKASIDLR